MLPTANGDHLLHTLSNSWASAGRSWGPKRLVQAGVSQEHTRSACLKWAQSYCMIGVSVVWTFKMVTHNDHLLGLSFSDLTRAECHLRAPQKATAWHGLQTNLGSI